MSFITHDVSTGQPDVTSLTLTKKKSIYEIRATGGKQLWFKVNHCALKYGYSENLYKSASPGTIVVSDMGGDLEGSVEAIDQFVIDTLTKQNLGSSLDNVMITENTISEMFRSSLYNGTIRVTIDDKCRVFDKNAKLLISPNLKEIFKKDLTIQLVVQPSFVWMMKPRIGVRWDAKQIKILGTVLDQPDDDESDDDQGGKPRSVSDTLKMFEDDDDEEN